MRRTPGLRRFEDLASHDPATIKPLSAKHSAIVNGHTLFRSRVVNAEDAPRLFVGGHNNRKIGGRITTGEWAGMPIYTLTLEERATCPSYCASWGTCYGNAMHWARRHRHGPELERLIPIEIAALAEKHPKGFVIRLHVLGDFYSTAYILMWLELLMEHKQLHIFGYTAHLRTTDLGWGINAMNVAFSNRCFIRFSGDTVRPGAAVVVMSDAKVNGAFVCPAETSKTECCGTCGLCWAPTVRDKAVLFILHGNPGAGTRHERDREIS